MSAFHPKLPLGRAGAQSPARECGRCRLPALLRQSGMGEDTLIPGGVVHQLPGDLAEALMRHPEALATWRDITPLARNEWICWVESAKKQETRRKRIDWGCSSLSEGKRRPCCWPGCPHREKGSG
jgi:hypothetical protein